MHRPSIGPKLLARPRPHRGRQLPDALLEFRLEQLCRLIEQAAQRSDQLHYEVGLCVAQANESNRELRVEVHNNPHLASNIWSFTAGECFRTILVEAGLLSQAPQQGQERPQLRLVANGD